MVEDGLPDRPAPQALPPGVQRCDALDPLLLNVKQETLPTKMLLLRWARSENQLRTENVNTHAPQPENPTHKRTDQ